MTRQSERGKYRGGVRWGAAGGCAHRGGHTHAAHALRGPPRFAQHRCQVIAGSCRCTCDLCKEHDASDGLMMICMFRGELKAAPYAAWQRHCTVLYAHTLHPPNNGLFL